MLSVVVISPLFQPTGTTRVCDVRVSTDRETQIPNSYLIDVGLLTAVFFNVKMWMLNCTLNATKVWRGGQYYDFEHLIQQANVKLSEQSCQRM